MKNKYDNVPTPFQRVKTFTTEYHRVWELCDLFHSGENGLPKWDKICEIPISATLAVMDAFPTANRTYFPAECAGLYAWRKYKEIYSFDNDLAILLMEQANDLRIPMEVLQNMPYPCFYVSHSKSAGFLVWIEDDIDTHIKELRFLHYKDNKPNGNYILHIHEGWTISDGITDMIETSKANCKDKEIIENMKLNNIDVDEAQKQIGHADDCFGEFYDVISRLIQLVLYICSTNADIVENENQKEITQRPQNDKIKKPKDKFREIQKWDIGFRIGDTIRKINSVESSGQSSHIGKGSTKRPHTRRGHYHHYWIGSNENNTKKIILRWVAPMFINGDEEDIIPTEHKVE